MKRLDLSPLRDRRRGSGRELVRLAFQADPRGLVLVGALSALVGFAGGAYALLMKVFADAAVERDLRVMVLAIAAYAAAALVADFLPQVVELRLQAVQERSFTVVDRKVRELLGAVPGIEHHERPDVQDQVALLVAGLQDLTRAADALVSVLTTLVRAGTTLLLLITLSPWLLLCALAGAPYAWSTRRAFAVQKAMEERLAQPLRLGGLLRQVWAAPNGRELRVFGAREVVSERDDALLRGIADDRVRTAGRAAWVQVLGATAVELATVLGTLWVALRCIRGQATVGDVAMALSALGSLTWHISSLGNDLSTALRIVTTMGRFGWLADYAAEQSRRELAEVAVPDQLREGIRLEGVRFRYPGTETEVLRGIDLVVPAGTTLALVGENGAGKTSIVKLLCGFYRPDAGRITVDGVDLRAFDVAAWRRRTTACFQDHVNPELPALHVVGIGDVGTNDEPSVVAALERAHATHVVDGLAGRLEQQLGRNFAGGVDLSGGQWQQLALARSMMRTRPLLLLLDEPTSALDALAEHTLFERYAAAAREAARETGGVTVLVSHRFSTVRNADLIAVVHEGELSEVGTHAELMARGGRYAELYELQASAYR